MSEAIPAIKTTGCYAPPKLTSIKLRPEEAVLGACKTSTTAGPSAGACRLCGVEIAT